MTTIPQPYRDYLERSCEWGGTTTIEDLESYIQKGTARLWTGEDCAAITYCEGNAHGLSVVVEFAGGSMKGLRNLEQEIAQYAKDVKADNLYLSGRVGWSRVFKEYKPAAIVLRKRIRHG